MSEALGEYSAVRAIRDQFLRENIGKTRVKRITFASQEELELWLTTNNIPTQCLRRTRDMVRYLEIYHDIKIFVDPEMTHRSPHVERTLV